MAEFDGVPKPSAVERICRRFDWRFTLEAPGSGGTLARIDFGG